MEKDDSLLRIEQNWLGQGFTRTGSVIELGFREAVGEKLPPQWEDQTLPVLNVCILYFASLPNSGSYFS